MPLELTTQMDVGDQLAFRIWSPLAKRFALG